MGDPRRDRGDCMGHRLPHQKKALFAPDQTGDALA
jgi:hypothetical protein